VERIAKAGNDFNSFIHSVYEVVCEVTRNIVTEMMESLDEQLMKDRDTSIYRNKGIRSTTVKTFIGDIAYKRRYYTRVDPSNEEIVRVFLLDEYLGIDGYIGKFCDDAIELITNSFMDLSCRKSAKAIMESTALEISHTTVWNAFQKASEQHQKHMDYLVEACNTKEVVGAIETKVLFKEADGVNISIQGKDRPKGYGKRELKVAKSYTGWKMIGKDRYETVDRVVYASFEKTNAFIKKVQALEEITYDTGGILKVIFGSDGAGWCKSVGEDADIFQLDTYHRNNAITRCIKDKAHRKAAMELIQQKDIDTLLDYVEALVTSYEDPDAVDKAIQLLTYFTNNKNELLTWKERDIELPDPPKGIVYRSLGTQEHTNANVICTRMKNNGTSWSLNGGSNMALMLSLRAHRGDPDWIYNTSAIRDTLLLASPEPLSAAQVPVAIGNGYDGVRHGGWPYSNASTTVGRKQIKNILEQKHISLIRYQG